MSLYRIEVKIVGTAYVQAPSKVEARRRLKASIGGIYADDWSNSEPEISAERFSSGKLPTVSLSPAMTVLGLYRGTDKAE